MTAELKRLMSDHGLTRRRLAELLGLKVHANGSNGTIDSWLSGRRNPPAYAMAAIRQLLKGLTVYRVIDQLGDPSYVETEDSAYRLAAKFGTTGSMQTLTIKTPRELALLLNQVSGEQHQ